MDRFNILLKKPIVKPVPDLSKMEDVPDRNIIRVELPPHPENLNRRVSVAAYSDYDRRPENINVQTIHPVEGDLLIFSLPLARADDLSVFQDVLESKIRELGVSCQVMVCNY
jgi:hypothetical protein